MGEVIELFGQTSILKSAPQKRQPKNDHTKNQPTQQQAPGVAKKSAAQTAYEIASRRRCYVCGTFLPFGSHGNYCERHPAAKYKFINCTAPGCSRVAIRRMFGHTQFTCPEHRKSQAPRQAINVDIGRPTQNTDGLSNREKVIRMIEQHKAQAARSRTKPQLPPRPPYNIGRTI